MKLRRLSDNDDIILKATVEEFEDVCKSVIETFNSNQVKDILNSVGSSQNIKYIFNRRGVEYNGNNYDGISQYIQNISYDFRNDAMELNINEINEALTSYYKRFNRLLEICKEILSSEDNKKKFERFTNTMLIKNKQFMQRMEVFNRKSKIKISVRELDKKLRIKGVSNSNRGLSGSAFDQCAEYMINSCLAFADYIKPGYGDKNDTAELAIYKKAQSIELDISEMGEIAKKFSDSKDFGLWYMIHELYHSITITLEELLRFFAEMICESTEIAINKINEKINANVSATDLEKIVQENVELWFNQINPIINYLFGSLYSKIDDSINNELLKTFGTAVETLRNVKTNLKKLKEPVNNNH